MGEGSTSPLGAALQDATTRLRTSLTSPSAPITILVPAGPNGVLARRALATRGAILRVWFETADGLLRQQLPMDVWRDLRPEPAGWLRVTLGRLLDAEAASTSTSMGRFAARLARKGWRDPLVASLQRLERDDVTPADLRAVKGDVHIVERASLLASLLDAIEQARTKEHIASPRFLTAAAVDAIDARTPGVGASLAAGAVVVGDRELSSSLHRFLLRWLADRPVIRVVCPPFGNVRAAERGMRSACPVGTQEVVVATDALPARLRSVAVSLFSPKPIATASEPAKDDSVVLARTPDDVRETTECVRVVQRAIDDGTPLDRIAIVLPDSKQRGPLEEALDRADIPTTWLVGYAAHDLPPARLLRLALDVARGDDSIARVYELLSHPTLDLRSQLGPDAIKGRGRWRRLLAKIVRARGIAIMANAIESMPVDEGDRALTDEEKEREVASRASLVRCLRTLDVELNAMKAVKAVKGPLGQHANVWTTFLKRYARVSDVRTKLIGLLEPWAISQAGPHLTLGQASEELESLLEREVARGNLSERSIRVLPPMYLVGGEVDVVCILGLTEGRFPKAVREDAILPDELLVAMSTQVGRPLSLSRSREELERRRFAAAVGAARKKLWLSVPGLDFEHERPTLPSTLALDVVSALIGRRARNHDLRAVAVRAGSRAQSWPKAEDVGTSLDALEHLVARVANQDASAVDALATHTTTRGLLSLHRSIALAQRGAPLDAWTGVVSPSTMRATGLDAAPISVHAIGELLESLGEFFFRQMLRAYRARSLHVWGAPLERPQLEELMIELARGASVNDPDPAKAVAAGVIQRLQRDRDLGAFDDGALTRAHPVVGALGRALVEVENGFLASAVLAGPLQIADDLPWTLTRAHGRVVLTDDGAALIDIQRKKPDRKTLKKLDRADLTLSALALNRAGVEKNVSELQVLTPSQGQALGSVALLSEFVMDALRTATACAERGEFPMQGADAFTLGAERKAPDENHVAGAMEGEGDA